MSTSEVVDRIREIQSKESDIYNQIQDVNDFFQGFLEELEEAGALSDSEIREYRELILAAEKNQTEAQKRCEDLGMIAKKITHMSVKLKNEILFAQKNQ